MAKAKIGADLIAEFPKIPNFSNTIMLKGDKAEFL